MSDIHICHMCPIPAHDLLERHPREQSLERMKRRLVAIKLVFAYHIQQRCLPQPGIAIWVIRDIREKRPRLVVIPGTGRPVDDDLEAVADDLFQVY